MRRKVGALPRTPLGAAPPDPHSFSSGRAALAFLLLLYPLHAYAVSSPAEMLANPGQEKRAEAIGSQLRCMVCQNQTIEDSDADLARDLRRIVRQRVVAGDSDTQVMGWMTARYGDFVRMRPPFRPLTWVLWFSPLIALAVGGGAALLGRRRPGAPPAPLSADERDRLEGLLRP